LYYPTVHRGYRQLDHTADLALEMWAPSEEDLLAAAAEAVTEIMTEGAELQATGQRTVVIDALDPADRLVQWMNDVVVAAVTEGFLYHSAAIELVGDTGLRAAVRGAPGAGGRVVTELKSVTYHDLELTRTGETWRARVVIDV
jgi:SHS2 domain-containing protein